MTTRPDPSSARDAASFVREMRRLKGWVGNPSFQHLSRQSGLPTSTLADATKSHRVGLPRLEVVRGFVAACGVAGETAAAWERAWRDIQSAASSGTARPRAINPRELPPDVAPFCGRLAAVRTLDEVLTEVGVPKLVAICGTAGVGKTALAMHWAHRVADRFPDGQLYINLCGYDANPPVTAESAVATFLHSLLPPGAPIPAGDREQLAMYRSLSADRSLLVVLDNAATPDDVRPLLPAGTDSVVLVTSRDAMAGLVARNGSRRIDLDAMPMADAVDLLGQLVGDRAIADPAATTALAERCARLPLALRLAAELAISNADSSIVTLLEDLDRADPLDELETGSDQQTSLRAVFSWSYRRLPADAARAFRLLGMHAGREYDVYAVAALADSSVTEARALIRTLARAHLLDEPVRGRHAMHDLLHAYAVELASGDAESAFAVRRLLDLYAYLATAAGDTVYPYPRPAVAVALPRPSTPLPSLGDAATARAWLDAERTNLIAVAMNPRWPDHVVALSAGLGRYLNVCGHFTDARVLHEQALPAARAVSNRAAEGKTLSLLGLTCGQTGALRDATAYLAEAREIATEIGDQLMLRSVLNSLGLVNDALGRHDEGCQVLTDALESARGGDPRMEAALLNNLGLCHEHAGRYPEALDLYSQASEKYREAGWRPGEGEVFYNIGNVNQRLGRTGLALENGSRALAIAQETGSIEVEMGALNSVGIALRSIGRFDEGAMRHEQALTLALRVGDQIEVARAHDGLGAIAHATGSTDDARSHWSEALDIYTEVGVPEADEVRARLSDLGLRASA
ncbi:MAG TPA: tetratricopeptide repeat protein [Jatrophihabitantaceae bacterium]|nr:tetratricopeptide repeat protein [Jatrophihabitantaceae bacterium]